MTKEFEQKIKKVREEAQAPYKTRIMIHRMKQILAQPKKEDTLEVKKKVEQENKVFSEGLEAVASIGESTFAVSTPRRFNDWARHNDLRNENSYFGIDRKEWNKKVPIERDGKFFVPYEEFSQTGYGAWHIGSAISGIKAQGRDILIINTPRNRRFLFKEVKQEELEKRI
jgi:hypothetical protein